MASDSNIILGVFRGTVTRHNLPVSYYKATSGELMDAVKTGMGKVKGFEDLYESLQYNVQAFAAAKTYNLVSELESLAKKYSSFQDYQDAAQATTKQYHGWGEAEVNTAQQQTHQAKQWKIIDEDKDLFPLLKYSTIGDACRICKPLDGIVAPVNSPIWRKVYPCNHYNCYCIVTQHTVATEDLTEHHELLKLVDGSTELMAPVFLSNPGVTEKVFTSKHPFFTNVNKDDKSFAKQNFGLPIK